jgi:hypothetical protein
MRVPNENLDDFRSSSGQPEPLEPPRAVWLRFSGETEVLKPLAGWDGSAKRGSSGLSWYHRSLVMTGVGMIALLLGIGIFVARYDATAEPVSPYDVAMDQPPAGVPMTPGDLGAPDMSSQDTLYPTEELPVVRKSARPRLTRQRVYRARRVRAPQITVSEFLPTTLIIYQENGEIKSRIEPQQLTAGYKRPVTFP